MGGVVSGLAGYILCCPDCAHPVCRDAMAHWDPATGRWVHADVCDTMWCRGCGEEVGEADEIPMNEWAETYPDLVAEYGFTL